MKFATKRSAPKWATPKRATTKWAAQKWSRHKGVYLSSGCFAHIVMSASYVACLINTQIMLMLIVNFPFILAHSYSSSVQHWLLKIMLSMSF